MFDKQGFCQAALGRPLRKAQGLLSLYAGRVCLPQDLVPHVDLTFTSFVANPAFAFIVSLWPIHGPVTPRLGSFLLVSADGTWRPPSLAPFSYSLTLKSTELGKGAIWSAPHTGHRGPGPQWGTCPSPDPEFTEGAGMPPDKVEFETDLMD